MTAASALVRPAAPRDAAAVAELIYLTSPVLHDRFAGGRERALAMLETGFRQPGSNVSAEVVHVAELEGQLAGAIACFPVEEARRRGRAVLRVALGCSPVRRWPTTLGLYLRGGRVAPGPPPDALYIDSLATDERFRRRGAARALLEWAERLAGRAGLPRVALDTTLDNHRARRLYERAGFEAVAQTHPRFGLPGFVSYVKRTANLTTHPSP